MNKKSDRFVIYICILSLVLATVFFAAGDGGETVYAATGSAVVKAGTGNLRVRETPGGNVMKDSSGNTIYLTGGDKLDVTDTTNATWYKVQFTYKNEEYTGYVSSSYVTFSDTNASTEASSTGSSNNNTSDEEFEKKLKQQKFPESYKPYLRALHEKHPDWEFVAVQTGIAWSTVVSKEVNRTGQVKNLVYCASSNPHYGWRSTVVGYNWSTDTYSTFDGSTWYAASDDLVKYYLDPRTYLNEQNIFAFESLKYEEGVQNIQGVNAILKGSFMYDKVPTGSTKTYAEIIMAAAKAYGASPYHLAARMRLEMGTKGCAQALGTHSVYPGIYNYFNIGASDSASGHAVSNGLKWASTGTTYGRPWTTPEKAIMGGSQYLAAMYINKKQDTIYTQKFNVTNTSALFSHQYMSNVQCPAQESQTNYKAYAANGILDSTMVFSIPVYTGMPETAMTKPSDTGNSNNYLKTLSITGKTLTPSFSGDVTEYSLIVDGSVNSINVSATAVTTKSKVTGTGTITLKNGSNEIDVKVTAENGSVRTYKITVIKENKNENSTEEYETGITGGVTKSLKGDLNGDSKINALDIVVIQRVIVGLETVTDDLVAVGDINKDGKVNVLDIVAIQRHIVGLESIN